MSMQHNATLLGATCWVRLATILRSVATRWVLLAQVWRWSNLIQRHLTCLNTTQHGGQTHPACCDQQCCDMLRWHVATGLYSICTRFSCTSIPVTETKILKTCKVQKVNNWWNMVSMETVKNLIRENLTTQTMFTDH